VKLNINFSCLEGNKYYQTNTLLCSRRSCCSP